LEAGIGNLLDAIGTGLLSATLSQRLREAEAERAALPATGTVFHVDEVMLALPKAVETYRRRASKLGDAPIDVERGRELLRDSSGRYE